MRRLALFVTLGLSLIAGAARPAQQLDSFSPHSSRELAWAPSGSHLAYLATVDEERELSILNVATGRSARVGRVEEPRFAWSPRSERLAVHLFPERSSKAAYTIRADGSNKLEFSPWAGEVVWSPVGDQLAYAGHGPGVHHAAIWVVGPDGSGLRRIADHGSEPSWSPDGSEIAYFAQVSCGFPCVNGLFLVRPDGSGRRLIAQDSDPNSFLQELSWAPDGSALVYEDHGYGVFVIDREGMSRRKVAAGGAAAWAPTGRRLAVLFGSSLRLVDADGGNATEIRAPVESVSWAPDGRRLAYSRGFETRLVNADGTGDRRLADGDAIAWSPIGERIAVVGRINTSDCVDRLIRVLDLRRNRWTYVTPCWIYGSTLNDELIGSPARDQVYALAGNDRILVRRGDRDVVRCGTGRDTVFADRLDRVARDCERVRRR